MTHEKLMIMIMELAIAYAYMMDDEVYERLTENER